MILNGLFEQELKSINIGLQSFKESLDDAGYSSVQVDWRPPAVEDEETIAALKKLLG